MRVTSIAMDYRKKFQKDVIIDFICFRKHGHNELDDPFFTNPKMYKAVRGRDSIPNIYANNIVVRNNTELSPSSVNVKLFLQFCLKRLSNSKTSSLGNFPMLILKLIIRLKYFSFSHCFMQENSLLWIPLFYLYLLMSKKKFKTLNLI